MEIISLAELTNNRQLIEGIALRQKKFGYHEGYYISEPDLSLL